MTPAWREVYGRILDELVFRHTGWWAARTGSPSSATTRSAVPTRTRTVSVIPADRWGDYDVPGWTANGIEPWGMQWDPIGADGNLFFRGFFLRAAGPLPAYDR